jgi:carbamoyl-phosphate synthase large subunit
VRHRVPCITTLAGAIAAAQGIQALGEGPLGVAPLQSYHEELEVMIESQA